MRSDTLGAALLAMELICVGIVWWVWQRIADRSSFVCLFVCLFFLLCSWQGQGVTDSGIILASTLFVPVGLWCLWLM